MGLSDTAEYWSDVKESRWLREQRLAPLEAIETMLTELREHGLLTFRAHKIKGHPKDSFIVNDRLRILPRFVWEDVKTGERGIYDTGLREFLARSFGFTVPPRYDFKLWFGKYQGEWASDVLNKDAQYLNWCVQNVRGFKRAYGSSVKKLLNL